ncbi:MULTISPECIES: hypothetical protein [Methylobacterium]|jgi:hypothetical protein|uniref:hypothetical protein n=1 Tax=Methylobacterium TaxID=407 RepID=UPI0011C8B7B9|nr:MULTISPECIES: hypothetical protein [Methylobacterium]TXN43807.1 hypothetical protein FV233_17190 [Methylobacterium sp. WL7]TXN74567.1 hypothetical protein FV228_05445 [Methylobacterium sp. WL18]GJE20401.1 hypothetical protein JHFBIEKO_0829 [Methylobacterium mesophilicum]
MPDGPTANTQDLAETEYDAHRRARAAAGHQPVPPGADSDQASPDEGPKAGSPDAKGSQHG